MPYNDQLEIKQPFGIDLPSVVLLMPEGITVTGDQLTSEGAVVIQNNNYQEFSASDFKTGDVLDFTVSGLPKTTASANNMPQIIFVGAGAAGCDIDRHKRLAVLPRSKEHPRRRG